MNSNLFDRPPTTLNRTDIAFDYADNEELSTSFCSSLTDGTELDLSSFSDYVDADPYIEISQASFQKEKKNLTHYNGQVVEASKALWLRNSDYPNKDSQKVDSKPAKAVSYAQLFFDPETKLLVTLMEVNLPNHSNILQKEWQKMKNIENTIPINSNSKGSYVVADESRFHDQTLLTECSSISSDTSREGPEIAKHKSSSFRFPDEPVVFSHNTLGQLWLEEGDLSLYLLHDSGDPWESGERKSLAGGCTETLKKLLTLRACISLGALRQMGDSRWKIVGRGTDSTPAEGLAYTVLNDA